MPAKTKEPLVYSGGSLYSRNRYQLMQPLRDAILIKADKPKEQTDSGIILGEQWKTLPLEGKVLAVGPDVSQVEVGDRVGFVRYASIVLENDERLCNERHILWRKS